MEARAARSCRGCGAPAVPVSASQAAPQDRCFVFTVPWLAGHGGERELLLPRFTAWPCRLALVHQPQEKQKLEQQVNYRGIYIFKVDASGAAAFWT